MAGANKSDKSTKTSTNQASANGNGKTNTATATPPEDIPQTLEAIAQSFDGYTITPSDTWPPPVFVRKTASMQEKFYIENRWYSQWKYYDSKATENKDRYFYYQRLVVIGSLLVPTLISLNSSLARGLAALYDGGATPVQAEAFWRIGIDAFTVLLSLSVAGAAALESLYKWGENWHSYRAAAEELQAEKSFYDMMSGPYEATPRPFAIFVERVEGIITKQNGNYFQALQQNIKQQSEKNEEIVQQFSSDEDGDGTPEFEATVTSTTSSVTSAG